MMREENLDLKKFEVISPKHEHFGKTCHFVRFEETFAGKAMKMQSGPEQFFIFNVEDVKEIRE